MSYFRHPATQQERRQAADPEIRQSIRPARRPNTLPTDWDDIPRARKGRANRRSTRPQNFRQTIRRLAE